MILNNHYCLSQDTEFDVYTPKGNPVTAWVMEEQNSAIRDYFDSYYSSLYPQNTKMTTYDNKSSTRRFNCHGYAWYMTETGMLFNSARWIGYLATTDEDVYMSDGSYVRVASEMYPGKVSWGSGDHSAVTTYTQGVFISKWNEYPLFRHNWNNTPYGNTNLRYYVSTMINGEKTVLCNSSSRNYTVRYIPNATYSWTVGSGLTKVENGNMVTVTASPSYSGSSFVEVTITSPIGGGQNDIKTSPRFEFWVGSFSSIYVTGQSSICPNSIYTYTADVLGGYSSSYSYTWTYPSNWYINSQYQNTVTLQTPSSPNYGTVRVSITNCSGTSGYSGITVYPRSGCGGRFFSIYPNPASDNVTINIDNTNTSDFVNSENFTQSASDLAPEKINESTNYTIKIYDKQGSLLSTKIRSGFNFNVPLINMFDGVYIIEVSDGKNSSRQQLIVKHN